MKKLKCPSCGCEFTPQREATNTRQRRHQEKLRRAGRCINCGEPRGKDGTRNHCRACADRRTEQVKRRYHEQKGHAT